MRDELNAVLQTAARSYFARGRRMARGWSPGPLPSAERIHGSALGQDLEWLERAAAGAIAPGIAEVEAVAGRVLDDLYRPPALDAPALPSGFEEMPLGQLLAAAHARAATAPSAMAAPPAEEPSAPSAVREPLAAAAKRVAPSAPAGGPNVSPTEWLLGESAIRGVLYLGGLLVTVAAAIFVAYNWGAFPGALKVASILATTAGVYALGYALERTPLRAAGVTFVAIGSLMAPLNFYALHSYLLGPAGMAPEASWLLGAAVCGALYITTARWLRSPLPSYAAALALAAGAGAALSALRAADYLWAPTGITIAGAVMAAAYEGGRRGLPEYFVVPFRRAALTAAGLLLLPLWALALDARPAFNPPWNSLLVGQAFAAVTLLFHGLTTRWHFTRMLAYALAAIDYIVLVRLFDLSPLPSGAALMAAGALAFALSQTAPIRRLGAADEWALRGAGYALALLTTQTALESQTPREQSSGATFNLLLALLADVGFLLASAYVDRGRRSGAAWRWAAAALFVWPWHLAATLLFPADQAAAFGRLGRTAAWTVPWSVSLALLSGLYLAAASFLSRRSAATALPLAVVALLVAPLAGFAAALLAGSRALGALLMLASAGAYFGVAAAAKLPWLLYLSLPQANVALAFALALDRPFFRDSVDFVLWNYAALALAYLSGAWFIEMRAARRWAQPGYVWGAITLALCWLAAMLDAIMARSHASLAHNDVRFLQVSAVAGAALLLLAWLRRPRAEAVGSSGFVTVYAALAALSCGGAWLLTHVGLGAYAPAFMALGLLAGALAGQALPPGAAADLYGKRLLHFGLTALAAPLLLTLDGGNPQVIALTFGIGAALYTLAAWLHQRRAFGYAAGLLLAIAHLAALEWQGVTETQAWAIPFGLGLLLAAHIERAGLSRWLLHPQEVSLLLTWSGLGLLYGTALWQAHGPGGVPYFLLLVAETAAGVLWGLRVRSRSWVMLSTGVLALEAILRLWDGLTALPAWAALGSAGSVLLGVGVLLLAKRQQMLALGRAAARQWEAWKV